MPGHNTEELHRIGKDISDIKGIFLTHAHPDHIGTVAWFKERTGCRVYAGAGEKPWIEDIDLQFAQRPIPNFHKLAGKSVQVDYILHGGDEITLEKDITLKAVSTPGHSAHELSFQIGSCAFIGDCIPVKGDIPIYINNHAAIDSINKIKNMTGIDMFYPAWDTVYSTDEIDKKAAEGIEIIEMIEKAVQRIKPNSPEKNYPIKNYPIKNYLIWSYPTLSYLIRSYLIRNYSDWYLRFAESLECRGLLLIRCLHERYKAI